MHEVVHLHSYPHSIEAHSDDVFWSGAIVPRTNIGLEGILQEHTDSAASFNREDVNTFTISDSTLGTHINLNRSANRHQSIHLTGTDFPAYSYIDDTHQRSCSYAR